jgi:hypothetical protein
VSASRRFHLWLPAELEFRLRSYARVRGLLLSPAIRLLVGRALESESEPPTPPADSSAALAALVAAEHVVLMVAAVLPEGQRRMRELAPQAAIAAEDRINLVRESGR